MWITEKLRNKMINRNLFRIKLKYVTLNWINISKYKNPTHRIVNDAILSFNSKKYWYIDQVQIESRKLCYVFEKLIVIYCY